jgi:uncharacterized protein YkwD/uncharacterized membrane protein required for colicin V production
VSPLVVDITTLALLILAFARGWARGSIREGFGLLGLFLGIFLAPFLVGLLGSVFENLFGMAVNPARVIALTLIVGIVWAGFIIVGIKASRGVDLPGPRSMNGVGGALLSVVSAITIISLTLYGALAVTGGAETAGAFSSSLRDSVTGHAFMDTESPFTLFYDSLLNRSAALRGLTLWVRQQTTFREDDPTDRLDFPGTDEKLTVAKDAEQQLFDKLNDERAKAGLDRLEWCEPCSLVARSHSKEMYREGYFSHVNTRGLDPFDRMEAAGIEFLSAGENLAVAPSVEEAHRGLMHSPDHRRNILRPRFTQVGIGIYNGPYGLMCTQVFRTPLAAN